MPIEFSIETLTVTINGLEFEVYSGLSLTPRQLGTIQLAAKKLQSMAQTELEDESQLAQFEDAVSTLADMLVVDKTAEHLAAINGLGAHQLNKLLEAVFSADPPSASGEFGEAAARLSRFYGGSPHDWYSQAPRWLIDCCLRLLPSLQAEEDLRAVNVAALGSGSLKPSDSRRAMEALKRQARSQSQERRPSTRAEILSTLAAVGLPVTKVKR